MKISIALTTFNGEKYIASQLESIMLQSRTPEEIIIADDMSSDLTVKICKDILRKYKYKNFRLIQNEKNLGYIKNFYQAIKMTSGDIIFLCDQDDVWFKDKLKNIENIFIRNKNVQAVNSGFIMIDSNEEIIPYKNHRGFLNNNMLKGNAETKELLNIPFEKIYRYNISPGCTMAFTKKIKNIYLEKSKCHLPHDWEINLIAALEKGLYFYNAPLISYRIHEKNTLGMDTNDHISNFDFKKDIDFRLSGLEDRKNLKEFSKLYESKWQKDENIAGQINRIRRFDDLRVECIEQHNLMAWLKMILLCFLLWDGKYARFKTAFGDLYYTLKNKMDR